jgi:peroxiredoxin
MRLSPVLILLFVLFSCSERKHNFKVEGTVSGSENNFIYLYKRSLSGTLPVDSTTISNKGTFVLKGSTDQPDFYILFVHKKQYINLIIHPRDRIKVDATAENFERDYFIEGSKDSRLIHKLVTRQSQTLDRITELSNEYENSLGRPDIMTTKARLDSLYEIIVQDHKQFSINFIQENKESLVSLMALYQQLGLKTPVFDYKKDFRYFELVDSALCIRYPYSEAVKDLNRKVTQIREILKVEIGSPAPSFTLQDVNGKPVSLSALKGRVVLVNFWASWSDASMMSNKALEILYNKFHAIGFEVIQVSLDRSRESWIKAIQEDKAGWIHVSDLLYWDSPVVKLYGIKNLPANYLIDSKGMIIAKNIRDQELELKLTELLY